MKMGDYLENLTRNDDLHHNHPSQSNGIGYEDMDTSLLLEVCTNY